MPLTADQVHELAHALHKAEHDLTPIGPLTERHPDMDLNDAYAIQLEGIRERTQAHGGSIIGWKVGLTSKAMQQMLGVDQPDFGHLLDDMRLDEGTNIDCSTMIWPRVEPEVAFQLNADLRGPNVTAADVMSATEYLIPSLEVIDSRIKDWKIKLCDTIADNASCGRFVLGRKRTPPQGFDIRLIGMNYYVNDDLVATATSAAVIGDPAEAIAWLANTLAPFDHYLHAGQVVMAGSLVAAVDAKPGGHIRADFDHIGSVDLRLK
ncbi:MAG TPA: fumarylacetoacetate hydrolase family protein [Dehalococcoidia bacterium]|nr:fumarylacetoacetate hydrolase family protein [Dehalococcoidia bacterium]